MTNGTSQGLFIVVAIIIFGIFVSLSYVVFGDTLEPAIVNLFTDSTDRASYDLTGELPDKAKVPIKDENLKNELKKILGKAEGESILAGDLKKLVNLDLSGKGITDLTGLQHAKNLETINLSNNNIVDITPISKLPKLVSVNLNNNKVVDISPLSGLTGLKDLDLKNNELLDKTTIPKFTGVNLKIGVDSKMESATIGYLLRSPTSITGKRTDTSAPYTDYKFVHDSTGTQTYVISEIKNITDADGIVKITITNAKDAKFIEILMPTPVKTYTYTNNKDVLGQVMSGYGTIEERTGKYTIAVLDIYGDTTTFDLVFSRN